MPTIFIFYIFAISLSLFLQKLPKCHLIIWSLPSECFLICLYVYLLLFFFFFQIFFIFSDGFFFFFFLAVMF